MEYRALCDIHMDTFGFNVPIMFT